MTVRSNGVELTASGRSRIDPSTLGTFYCVAAAVAYALMGICMRELSMRCDPVWVNCVQALVGTVVTAAYLIVLSARGRSLWPPLSVVVALMVLGAVTQLGGAFYQWALGKIGLAICNPLQMGVTLAVSALLGLLVMRERVSGRGIAAIIVLTIAIVFLSLGANTANKAIGSGEASATQSASSEDSSEIDETTLRGDRTLLVTLGVVAAALSGIAFAILTVGVRKVATSATAPVAIVFYINLMGILFLGPWSLQRLGVDGLGATTPSDLATMLGVGACNLFGFLLLTKGLQLTTVVRVNIVSNSLTIALTVLAGIVIFDEPVSRPMFLGMILTFAGVAIIGLAGVEAVKDLPEETSEASCEL